MSPKATSKRPPSSDSSSESSSDDEPVVKNSKTKNSNISPAKSKAAITPKVVEKPVPKVTSPQKTATPVHSIPDKVPDRKFPKRKASSSSSSESSSDDEATANNSQTKTPVVAKPAPKVAEKPAPKVVEKPAPKVVEKPAPKVVEKPAPKVIAPPKTATPARSVPDKASEKKNTKRKASSSSSSESSSDDEPIANNSQTKISYTSPAKSKAVETPKVVEKPAPKVAEKPAPKSIPPQKTATPLRPVPDKVPERKNSKRRASTSSSDDSSKKAKVQALPAENNKAQVPQNQTPRMKTQSAQAIETPRTETKKIVGSMFDTTCPHCGHGLEVKFKMS